MTQRRSVIICDDHAAVRAGVARILEDVHAYIVGDCNTTSDLLELVRKHPSAIVVTDLGIDNVPFPTLMTRLREVSPDCRVVICSMREAPATIELCYDAGAMAFIPKSADSEEIRRALEFVGQRKRYVPPPVVAILADFRLTDGNSPLSLLSIQEKDVFVGYAHGESVAQLADRLAVSDKRIQNLLSQISKKMDTSRTAFAQVARRYGLME